MPRSTLARWVLMATVASVGAAQARDGSDDTLPCNSLCRRWMGLAPDQAAVVADPPVVSRPLPPPQSILPSDAVLAQSGAPVAKPLQPKSDAGAKHAPSAGARIVVRREVEHTVPLPPQRMRDREMPFGALAQLDAVERTIVSLPVPPLAPVVAIAATPVPVAPESRVTVTAVVAAITPDLPPPVTLSPAPHPAGETATQPILVVAPAPESVSAPRARADWPPPIDIIGAILMTTPVRPKGEAATF